MPCHDHLLASAGSLGTLVDGRLVVLNSAAGSPKLDLAASLDFVKTRDSLDFVEKMKTQGPALLEALEGWCDRQAHGMELARNLEGVTKNFDSLLKVMDALYQVCWAKRVGGQGREERQGGEAYVSCSLRAAEICTSQARHVLTCNSHCAHYPCTLLAQVKVKKVETDLLIDQLHEVFAYLGQHKVQVSKLEKRLDDVAHKWDDIKKAQPQVKTDVEPIQVNEANRIKAEVEKFGSRVRMGLGAVVLGVVVAAGAREGCVAEAAGSCLLASSACSN